jgi:hypothetical protein
MAVMKNTKKGIKMKLTKKQKNRIELLVEQSFVDPKKRVILATRIASILTGSTPTERAALAEFQDRLEEALYEYLLVTDRIHGKIKCGEIVKEIHLNKSRFKKYDATISIDVD